MIQPLAQLKNADPNDATIYLSSPKMSEEGYEMHYIQDAFSTNWIAPVGHNIDAFENELASLVNIPAAVALNTGTAAIHMALKAANVEAGDIVFCSTFTFAASVNPILYEGAIPVFIDSDLKTWNMCPNALRQALLKYPQVKAIIVVHLYGLSAEMDEIVEMCQQRDITIIEDAAESLGAFYKGRALGTLGHYGVYSFNGNKIITSSSGGMLIGHQPEKIQKVKFWASQSKDEAPFYLHSEIGYNYRLSNVCAGIGRGQLKILQQRIEQKKRIFDYYEEQLQSINDIQFMPINDGNTPNYWLTVITLNGTIKPSQVIQALQERQIESRHVWKPLHTQPAYEHLDYIGTNVAQQLFETGVCLPSDVNMTEVQLQKVVETIKQLWRV